MRGSDIHRSRKAGTYPRKAIDSCILGRTACTVKDTTSECPWGGNGRGCPDRQGCCSRIGSTNCTRQTSYQCQSDASHSLGTVRPRMMNTKAFSSGANIMINHSQGFCSIDEAIDELRRGRMVVLVDDEHRENEGDLVIAAEKVTPQAINFMIRNACGRLCLAMTGEMCDRAGLQLLPGVNLDPSATPFTHNFDARLGVTTGISAFDRAKSIQTAIADDVTPNDLVKDKGHMDGLRAPRGRRSRACRPYGRQR